MNGLRKLNLEIIFSYHDWMLQVRT